MQTTFFNQKSYNRDRYDEQGQVVDDGSTVKYDRDV